jgi:hypothetical protein
LVVGAITTGLASDDKRCDQSLTIVQVVGAWWVLALKASNKRAFNSRLNGAELGLGLLMKASTAILVMQLYGRVPNLVQDDGLVIGDIADLEVAHDVAYGHF